MLIYLFLKKNLQIKFMVKYSNDNLIMDILILNNIDIVYFIYFIYNKYIFYI